MLRTTALLLACFILAQADKQVMGLLAIDVQQSFQLTNTELGFLQGGAFAIAFAIGGLPISRLIDSGNRVKLAAACVAVWSVATILCGFAGSFAALLLCRAATAVAEAGLPPAAFSIFSQQRDRSRIARMTGIFMLAPFVGTGLMFMLGGWLLGFARSSLVPFTGGWDPWRVVFVAVGVPGLILAPMLALIGREPSRAQRGPDTATPGFRSVFALIFVERPFLRNYYLGLMAFYAATASLLAWYPALLVKSMGLTIGSAGAYAGAVYLAGGVTGTLVATAFFSSRRDLTPVSIARVFMLLAAMLGPVLIALPLTETLGVSLAIYGLFAFLSSAVLAIMPVPIQLVLDDSVRARGTAILSLLMSACAGTIGPLFVGAFMDLTGEPLRIALMVTMLLSALASVWFFVRTVLVQDSGIEDINLTTNR